MDAAAIDMLVDVTVVASREDRIPAQLSHTVRVQLGADEPESLAATVAEREVRACEPWADSVRAVRWRSVR